MPVDSEHTPQKTQMRASITLKIFGIALVMTVAMATISLFNLQSANRTSGHVARFIHRYLAASSAISSLGVHSLDQAVQLRNFLLLSGKTSNEPIDLSVFAKRISEHSNQFHKQLQTARELIADELSETDFSDPKQLARIDERLKEIENQQMLYEGRISKIYSLSEGGRPVAIATFAEHAAWRETFTRYINDTSSMLFEAARMAGELAIEEQRRTRSISLLLLIVTSLTAGIASVLLSRQLAHPVRRLLEGTQSVASGNLDLRLPITSSDEIGHLTSAFNQMVEELTHGKQARETFGQYVDPRIVRSLIESPDPGDLNGQRRQMTILFCDMKGFTSISESLTPTGLVTLMNRYCTLMSESVRLHEGVIDKFIGDAVMAYWGEPFGSDQDQGRLALLSVLSQIESIHQLSEELPDLLHLRQNLPQLDVRIGVATGEVLVGSIGSDLMRSFTVMGDAVNLASRLESANKAYGTRTLISEETVNRVGDEFTLREIDSLQVVGQKKPIRVFELMGLTRSITPAAMALKTHYESGLLAYRAANWLEAESQFSKALAIAPDDGPSQTLSKRIDLLRAEPPGDSWRGTWVMESK